MLKAFVFAALTILNFIMGCGDRSSVDSKNSSEHELLQKENESLKKENGQLKEELALLKNNRQDKNKSGIENKGDIEENVEKDELVKNPSSQQLKSDVEAKFRNTKIEVLSVKEVSRKETSAEWLAVYCEVKVKADDKDKYNYMYIKQGISLIDATMKYKKIGANWKCDIAMSDIAKR